MAKRLIILGATGSIGLNAIDVVKTHPDEFRVVALAALRSREKCEALAKDLGAKAYVGENAAVRAVEENDADICLVATVGMSGLRPTLAAIAKGMDIALATKEVMVMAGEFVTSEAKKKGVKFLPVDSEHSAIFQSLGGQLRHAAVHVVDLRQHDHGENVYQNGLVHVDDIGVQPCADAGNLGQNAHGVLANNGDNGFIHNYDLQFTDLLFTIYLV